METSDFLMLNANELKSLIEREKKFELLHKIKIQYPDIVSTASVNEVIFVTISGEKHNVEEAKVSFFKFLSEKEKIFNQVNTALSSEICNDKNVPLSKKQEFCHEANIPLPSKKTEIRNEKATSSSEILVICNEESIPLSKKQKFCTEANFISPSKEHEICNEENIPLVVLSDSDSDNEVEIVSLKRKRSVSFMNDSVKVTCPQVEIFSGKQKALKQEANNKLNHVLQNPNSKKALQPIPKNVVQQNSKMSVQKNSTQQNLKKSMSPNSKKSAQSNSKNLMEKNSRFSTQPNFIPIRLNTRKKKKGKLTLQLTQVSTSQRPTQVSTSQCLAQVTIPKKIITDPTRLRPVAIDASNVARSHGKSTNTFSCKGILLSVRYFLEKNHSSVKAFVPLSMRSRKHFNHIEITDQHLLDEMHSSGHLVFTPSRFLQGKCITCYDDRFIVEYASATGGVILSNDNYRDLVNESEDFKKTIEERLLLYCFAEDVLMIPKDPLGRRGPTLDEFLSFPEVQLEQRTVDMDESVIIIEEPLPVTSTGQSVSSLQRVL